MDFEIIDYNITPVENKLYNPNTTLKIPDGFTNILEKIKDRNVFIHGFAGTGKSTRIQYLKKVYEENNKKIILTSTTGISAININGITIHSFSGIGYAEDDKEIIMSKMGPMRQNLLCEKFKKYDAIVIDEVSMLSGSYLDKINYVFQHILRNDKPFGGKQIIFSGDVLQLPPISDTEEVDYFFKSDIWKQIQPNLYIIELNRPFRQIQDKTWFDLLMRIRYDVMNVKDHELLESRLIKNFTEDQIPKHCPMLYPTKKSVNYYNEKKINELKTEEFKYEAYDITFNFSDEQKMKYIFNPSISFLTTYKIKDSAENDKLKLKFDDYSEQIKKFKIGATVMLTTNMYMLDTCYLANGSQGVIHSFLHRSVNVEFTQYPGKIIPIPYYAHQIHINNTTFARYQIPLILSWAVTIHKVQGISLDCAKIDIGNSIFEASQSYVALSRVKKLSGVYLLHYNRNSIISNKEAIEYAICLSKFADH